MARRVVPGKTYILHLQCLRTVAVVFLAVVGAVLIPSLQNVALAQGTAAQEPLTQTEERFNCRTEGEWSKDSASAAQVQGHGFTKCNQEWALMNANEIISIRTVQLSRIQSELEDARNGPNPSAYQAKLANDHLCKPPGTGPGEESFTDCYDRVKRHILSQSVTLRESTIQNNTNRYLLGDKADGMTAAHVAPQPGEAPLSKDPGQAKYGFQIIQEYRQQKNPQQRRNPCDQNPFVPCTVTFGKNSLDNNKNLPQVDEATTRILQKGAISDVATKTVESGEGTQAEVRQGEDQRFRKEIDTRLNEKNGTFSKTAFGADIEHAKAVQNELNARDRKGATVIQDPNANTSASWDAFNKTMDMLENQKKAESKQGGNSAVGARTFAIQIQRDSAKAANQNGRTQAAARGENLSANGILEDTLGMSPAAAPSPGSATPPAPRPTAPPAPPTGTTPP